MLEQRVSSSAAAVSDISCADQAQQASTNDRPPSSNRAALHKGRTSADAANVQQERGQLEEGGHFGHGCCPSQGVSSLAPPMHQLFQGQPLSSRAGQGMEHGCRSKTSRTTTSMRSRTERMSQTKNCYSRASLCDKVTMPHEVAA